MHGHMVTFPQSCFKAVKKFINDVTFVWYAEFQFIISLLYSSKSFQKLLSNDAEISRMIRSRLVARNFAERTSPL